MKPYQNLSGNSTVKSYQLYGDGIKIEFADESVYLYLYDKIEKDVVEKMKALASEGKGLATYLNQHANGLGEKIEHS